VKCSISSNDGVRRNVPLSRALARGALAMTVVAFVGDPADAKPVVTWAGRFAAAQNAELVVFYLPRTANVGDFLLAVDGGGEFHDETHAAVTKAVESVVRTKRARKGRLPRHAVSIRRVSGPDPVAGTIARVRSESPTLFVGAATPANGKVIAQQIAAKTACDTIVLFGARNCVPKMQRIIVATTDGVHDRPAVELAAQTATAITEGVKVVCVEASLGKEAIQVGERQLRSLLRELSLEESSRLKVKAVAAEDTVRGIAEEASDGDLLLVGANMEKKVPRLLETTPGALVGLFRRAPRLTFGRHQRQAAWLLPQINATDYADLFEKLQSGSRWNSDFIVMLTLAAGIATLGLLQSSPAVVIGSMLLAPLMTPMIGMGLALNQGNSKLAYACFHAIGRGFLAALGVSLFVGLITPGSDLTPEVFARTEPNILDLLIALFSGAAAAYAMARPSLVGTIAGVAIATALVPPLCAIGLSLAYLKFAASIGAFFLLLANVLAIILAAAATFRAMGIGALTAAAPRQFWVGHVVNGLTVCVLVITIPLGITFMRQVREGKTAPIAFALTDEIRNVLLEHIDKKPGVEILFAGRTGVDREAEPIDVAIILSSKQPLPRTEADALVQLMRTTMENPDLQVSVECVVAGWADAPPDAPNASVEAQAPG
jgi:uncharacterized hydrophobic protein (TIGR00271 family)